MLIKLDDADKMLSEKFSIGVHGTIIAALRALPTVSVSEEMVNAAAIRLYALDGGKCFDTSMRRGHFIEQARAALEAALGATVSDGWEDIARDALGEAEWCLKCGVDVPIADLDYHEEVKALGDRIGYGALMPTASKAWREALEVEGIKGGEFVTGPCRSTVEKALAKIRAALGPLPAPPSE